VEHLIDSITSCLQNIRITNDFMLMTINRCIDYTKASRGLKLTPKYETIDLAETLKLPLSCMMNVQSKVSIQMNPITDIICTHIITDKQWLQENILCLLSNAVKYSTDGNVSISASLVMACKIANPIPNNSLSVAKSTNMKTETLSKDEPAVTDLDASTSREKPILHVANSSMSGTNKIHPIEQPVDDSSDTCNCHHVHGFSSPSDSTVLRHQVLPSMLTTPRDADTDSSTQILSGRITQKDIPSSLTNSPLQVHRRTLLGHQKEEASCTHHLLFEIEDTG
jgi:hypothetical protein